MSRSDSAETIPDMYIPARVISNVPIWAPVAQRTTKPPSFVSDKEFRMGDVFDDVCDAVSRFASEEGGVDEDGDGDGGEALRDPRDDMTRDIGAALDKNREEPVLHDEDREILLTTDETPSFEETSTLHCSPSSSSSYEYPRLHYSASRHSLRPSTPEIIELVNSSSSRSSPGSLYSLELADTLDYLSAPSIATHVATELSLPTVHYSSDSGFQENKPQELVFHTQNPEDFCSDDSLSSTESDLSDLLSTDSDGTYSEHSRLGDDAVHGPFTKKFLTKMDPLLTPKPTFATTDPKPIVLDEGRPYKQLPSPDVPQGHYQGKPLPAAPPRDRTLLREVVEPSRPSIEARSEFSWTPSESFHADATRLEQPPTLRQRKSKLSMLFGKVKQLVRKPKQIT